MIWAIVVAAGSGQRFGGPKQFEVLAGHSMLERAMAVAAEVADFVVAVLPAGAANGVAAPPNYRFTEGGASRSASVRAGLSVVPSDAELVVVHDAARPLATAALFQAVVDAVRKGADAAIPGLSMADTVKTVETDGRDVVVRATLDRSTLVSVQTPQAFRADALRAAHATGADATDDAALVEAQGGRVVVVAGESTNLKVTVPADLDVARRLAT